MARRNSDDEVQTFEVVETLSGHHVDETRETESSRRAKATLESMSGSSEVGDGYIVITKMDRGNEARCEKVAADKYTWDDLLDYVKDKYEPGDFRFRLYVRGPSNRYQLAENRMETLLGVTKSTPMVPAALGTDPALLSLLERQQSQIEAITKRMESQGQFDASKMVNTVAGFVTAIAPVLPMFVGRRSNPMSDLKELIAVTQGVKELQGGPVSEASTGASTLDLINTGLQTFGSLLAARGSVQPPIAPVDAPSVLQLAPPQTITPPQTVAPPQTIAPVDSDPDVSLFVDKADLLISACKANPTAEGALSAANLAASQIPAAVQLHVLNVLEHPFFMRALIRQRPDLLDIIDWLGYMREELFEILAAANDDSPHANENNPNGDTGRGAGNSSHSEANEAHHTGERD